MHEKNALGPSFSVALFLSSSWPLQWRDCSASEHWGAQFLSSLSPSVSPQKYVYMLQCQPLEAKRVGYSTAPNMRVKPHVPAFILIAAFWLSVSGSAASNDDVETRRCRRTFSADERTHESPVAPKPLRNLQDNSKALAVPSVVGGGG